LKLSAPQAQRYARHILLDEVGKDGQLRLLGSSVRVVGAGAAAEEAVRYLVAAGVGSLVVAESLLAEHRARWADLNEEVELRSEGEHAHMIDLGSSSSRLEGVRAALGLLVTVAVEGEI